MGNIATTGGGDGAELDVITATAADVRKNKVIVDKDGNPVGGTMPDIAGRTITPAASQQTINGGGYLTGNVVVPGFAMPAANIIKKGAAVSLYGRTVVGTWEGYVADAQDLYYMGNNPAGFSGGTLESGMIRTSIHSTSSIVGGSGHSGITTSKSYNLTPYSRLQVSGSTSAGNTNIYIEVFQGNELAADKSVVFSGGDSFNASVDIGSLNITGLVRVAFTRDGLKFGDTKPLSIFRVRLV